MTQQLDQRDLKAIRLGLADVLRTIPEFRTVYPYEARRTTIRELPCAWIWRAGVSPAEVQEFGRTTVDISFRVRIMHQLDEDGPAQAFNDLLVMRLIQAVESDETMEAAGLVDSISFGGADEPGYTTVDQLPALTIEASVTATITGDTSPATG